jgi:tetratricopeptide (TPR) repeat protein
MKLGRWLACACVPFTLLAVGCGGPKLYLVEEWKAPLSPDIVALRAIAVIPVGTDTEEDAKYGQMLAEELQSCLFKRFQRHPNVPKLVSRDLIAKVIEEQHFSSSDLVKPQTAIQVGQLVAADAVIYGKVAINFSSAKGIAYRAAYPYVPQTTERQTVSAQATLNMIDVETGAILRNESVYRSPGWLGSAESTIRKAIMECVGEFADTLVPRSKRMHEVKMAGSRDRLIKEGNTFAKSKDWGSAAQKFEEAIRLRPVDHHVAYYNLALMQLLLGNADAAQASVDKAINIKVDQKYTNLRMQMNAWRAAGTEISHATPEEKAEFESEKRAAKGK